jgi:hypothetical protein
MPGTMCWINADGSTTCGIFYDWFWWLLGH